MRVTPFPPTCEPVKLILRPTPNALLRSAQAPPRRIRSHASPDTASRPHANASNNANEGVHGTKLSSMSPDVLAMFNEAQRNIMELNRSRLKALEELKDAKQRISELEAQLDHAKARQAVAQEQVMVTQQSLRESWAQPEPQPQPTPAPQEQAALTATAPPAAPASPSSSTATSLITIVYETGWDTAFCHYNADGKGWTKVPGQKMEAGTGKYDKKKVFKLEAKRMEFVTTNGHDWDSPDPYGGSDNYKAEGPGVWLLKGGRLEKVE